MKCQNVWQICQNPEHVISVVRTRPPEDMPDRMSEDMPDKMSEGMSDRMSEDLPEGMPGGSPNRICQKLRQIESLKEGHRECQK